MMAAHDRHDRIRKIDQREDVGADVHMALHLLELGLVQLAGLVEDVLGHGELAGVVQQRRRFDRLERRLVGDAKRASQAERVRLHAAHVAVRHVVFGVDRHRERLDCRQIQTIEMREMLLRILEAAERRPQREVKHNEQRQHDDRRIRLA